MIKPSKSKLEFNKIDQLVYKRYGPTLEEIEDMDRNLQKLKGELFKKLL